MTTIKFHAGEQVFWLSSTGFKKGVIKRIFFNEERIIGGKLSKQLVYYLTDDPDGKYQGDAVSEHLVFTSYEASVEYYKNNPVFTTTTNQ